MRPLRERSISARIFKIVFFGNIIGLVALLSFSWLALEHLEQTTFEVDRAIEIEYFDNYGDKKNSHYTNTSQMISVFQTRRDLNPEKLPIVFKNIPVPFQGEVKALKSKYLIIAHKFAEGNLYIAKNLHLFEEEKEILIFSIKTLFFILSIFSFILAIIASRIISHPIVKFSESINSKTPSILKTSIQEDFSDSELNKISSAINHLLDKIDAGVKRERHLISMASHELKTPVAVVLGAADVIKNRGQLSSADSETLGRITAAALEMKNNIQVLLHLAKEGKALALNETFHLSDLISNLSKNYAIENPLTINRLNIASEKSDTYIRGNKVLARILIHNLISNALNHTEGQVIVFWDEKSISIVDENNATFYLPKEFAIEATNPGATTGLGLYIAHLTCEALGWHYTNAITDKGHCTQLWFSANP